MTPQLLPDIERGETWSEDWKRICLVRSIARQPKPLRLRFYELWSRRHGKASAEQLAREVSAEWQATCAGQG
jgi:hypothetical protein